MQDGAAKEGGVAMEEGVAVWTVPVETEQRIGFEVLSPGLFTTVQDLGRPGWQRFGVPAAGALDKYALMAANALVGNAPGAAGLEITLAGPVLAVMSEGLVACTGADLGCGVHPRFPLHRRALYRRA